jgi:potassium-transporting ATPase ATP-binding subunit
MSGIDLPDGRIIRKGAVSAIITAAVEQFGQRASSDLQSIADGVSRRGATPLAVSVDGVILGIPVLSDMLKPGIRERMQELRKMAVRTVMVTGDNPLAKEAANLIDLDSDPTKLTDLVAIGRQMLITRGALTTFSIANDVAKYFAIIPAMFIIALPGLAALNVMGLATPQSAVLSALIFNALIIPLLIPLALRGVHFRAETAETLFQRNLWIYGLGGLIAPFIGIKLIDLMIAPLV